MESEDKLNYAAHVLGYSQLLLELMNDKLVKLDPENDEFSNKINYIRQVILRIYNNIHFVDVNNMAEDL